MGYAVHRAKSYGIQPFLTHSSNRQGAGDITRRGSSGKQNRSCYSTTAGSGLKQERKHRLRSGYTTGACAAAAAKAAMICILSDMAPDSVEIPFPNGSRHRFMIKRAAISREGIEAYASVIKDAGDDPDVTNGAEIITTVRITNSREPDTTSYGPASASLPEITFCAGQGVGTVTRPGLAVPPGEPAINPGPRKMIREAIIEAMQQDDTGRGMTSPYPIQSIEVTVSIPNGKELASKTLNRRLGIVGGLSILGSTGIVRPVSARAWTDTIDVSLRVAREAGCQEVILSTGRTSERVVQERLKLPEPAMIMMGDYIEHTLKSAGKTGFSRLHLAMMWAKMVKAAMKIPQTHVRHGAIDIENTLKLLEKAGMDRQMRRELENANTARHILEILQTHGRSDIIRRVCEMAWEYAVMVSGIPVTIYLVHSNRGIIETVE